MQTRSFLAASALLLAALGCRDDVGSPTVPTPTGPQEGLAEVTGLVFSQVSAGSRHTCGVTSDHRAYCWGWNFAGQLGDGTSSDRLVPVAVAGGLRFRMLSAGGYHTCGVTTDSLAFCWGFNSIGQLGDGSDTDQRTPVPVAGGFRFRQVSAGDSHTCGVTTDRRAYCWGANNYGQLGDAGAPYPHPTPVLVKGGLHFRHVSTGLWHTCGVSTTDRAYCWGQNRFAQLGDSTEVEFRTVPVRVVGGRHYRQLEAGGSHTCAVTTDYRAFCWGNGRVGQLGNGRTYLSFWPRRVAGGLSLERVTGGLTHTCAEATDNRAYCWGENTYGQLGMGNNTGPETCVAYGNSYDCSTRPVAVTGGLYFQQVSGGDLHSCGKAENGTVYCWGSNGYGQLGDGTTNQRPRPTPVAGPL